MGEVVETVATIPVFERGFKVIEEWKPVPGYEGEYEVSNWGGVRSLDRRVPVRKDGSATRIAKGRVLKPYRSTHGHLRVYLRGRVFGVHRLVAMAFVPNPEGKPNVLHWDDNPQNNHSDNLRWGTQKENAADIIRNGNNPYLNRTHCKRGHEYNEENTYIPPTRPRERQCKKCSKEYGKMYWREKHGQNIKYRD